MLKKVAGWLASCSWVFFQPLVWRRPVTQTLLRQSLGTSGKRYAPLIWWWRENSERQGLEVLHGSREEELVARTGKTSQPHALEAVVSLGGQSALDTFALVA